MGSRFIEYTTQNNTADCIALSQKCIATQALILNGYTNGIIAAQGFSYRVSLSSSADFSTVSFTITGYHNNKLITNTINGPQQGTVFSSDLFDTVISIVPAMTSNSSVFAGIVANQTGSPAIDIYSLPIMIDSPYKKGINCLVSIDGTLLASDNTKFYSTYNLYGSLKNISNNSQTIASMINHELIPLVSSTITPANSAFPITTPLKYVVLKITTQLINATDKPYTTLRFAQSN